MKKDEVNIKATLSIWFKIEDNLKAGYFTWDLILFKHPAKAKAVNPLACAKTASILRYNTRGEAEKAGRELAEMMNCTIDRYSRTKLETREDAKGFIEEYAKEAIKWAQEKSRKEQLGNEK